MKTKVNISFDEMVFERRNLSYGAYKLRKGYSTNIAISLLLTLTLFAIAVVTLSFKKSETNVEPKVIKFYRSDSTIVFPPVRPPKEPKIRPHTFHGFSHPVIISTDPDTLVKNIDNGYSILIIGIGDISTTTGTDNHSDIFEDLGKSSRKPIEVAEPALFKGKIADTIRKYLRYPQKSIQNAVQGKVYLQFVVGKDGSVSDIIVLKSSVDDLCTTEAIRVIKMLDKWEPARHNGEMVDSYFRIPIVFKIEF